MKAPGTQHHHFVGGTAAAGRAWLRALLDPRGSWGGARLGAGARRNGFEQELATAMTQVERLEAMARGLLSIGPQPFAEATDMMLDVVVNATGVTQASFFRYEPASQTFVLEAETTPIPGLLEHARHRLVFHFGEKRGLVGVVGARRRPVYVPDCRAEPDWVAVRSEIRSVYIFPVLFGDDLYGVVRLLSETVDGISPEQRAMADTVAASTGAALQNARYDAFVSIAAHELRNPMTTIMGFAELLLDRDEPEAVRKGWLQHIRRDSRRLALILDDLLNVSRIHSGKLTLDLQELPLYSAVEEALAGIRPTTDAHEFVVDIPSDLPRVVADRDKLIQVLTNILDNAVKYSPTGGPIAISVTRDARRVVVAVADQGIGIRLEDQKDLFTAFHRIRRAGTESIMGTGLGLYIVKALLQLMHGEIWVRSEPGRGSTFLFSLPVRSTDAAENAA